MRRHPVTMSAALLLGSLFGNSVENSHLQGQPVKRSDVNQLVQTLGNSKVAERDDAEARLYTIGEPALDALRQAASSQDVEIRRRAAKLVSAIEDLLGRKVYVASAAFSPDGRTALIASSGMSPATLWYKDLEKGEVLHYLRGHPYGVGQVAMSSDSRLALIPGFHTSEGEPDNYHVQLWDLATARRLKHMRGHQLPVYSVVFSPNDKQAISCSSDKTIRLWDVETGREVRRFEGHTSNVFRAIFSPDGNSILSCGMDGTMRLWAAESAKQLQCIDLGSYVNAIAISPDGKRALTTTGIRSLNRDGTITFKGLTMKLWDLATGIELQSFSGHEEMIMTLAFSPDGRHGLSCAWDGTARLWDLQTGAEVARFRAKESKLVCCAFVKNGTRIMAACVDGTIESWDVPKK